MSTVVEAFPHNWKVEVLKAAPLIAPARQFTYPRRVAGEEEAMARGALLLMVSPSAGGNFLATCALGFTDPSAPTGVYTCPNADEICAVAGGYAYIFDANEPARTTHIPLKPVTQVLAVPSHGLLVFAGFYTLYAWGAQGEAWQTGRLSWEGVRITGVEGDTLHGMGWDMLADKEIPFAVDLRTGKHEGGASPRT
jgi:hypothetical protein